MIVQQNQSVPLNVPGEHQTGGRLSVIVDQTYKRRQEFSVKVIKLNLYSFFLFK